MGKKHEENKSATQLACDDLKTNQRAMQELKLEYPSEFELFELTNALELSKWNEKFVRDDIYVNEHYNHIHSSVAAKSEKIKLLQQKLAQHNAMTQQIITQIKAHVLIRDVLTDQELEQLQTPEYNLKNHLPLWEQHPMIDIESAAENVSQCEVKLHFAKCNEKNSDAALQSLMRSIEDIGKSFGLIRCENDDDDAIVD